MRCHHNGRRFGPSGFATDNQEGTYFFEPSFLYMEGTDMDIIEIFKAVLEIAGGLALIGACVAISVNVKIVIHLGKPRKTRKKSKK